MLTFFFSDAVLGVYTKNEELIRIAFWPFTVMLANYLFSVPAHIYCNAVTGTGRTRTAFLFEVVTTVFYVIYLYVLSATPNLPLAVYWTTEHIYVLSLFVLSYWYMKCVYKKTYRL